MKEQLKWMERFLECGRALGITKDAELARRMGVKPQTLNTWKTRGLPIERLEDAARSTETTIEYLKTGLNVARFHHQLTEEQRFILDVFATLDDEDRKRFLEPARLEAERIKRYQKR